MPGGIVTIGDPDPEPDVIFQWSNGKDTNTIDVEFPGIYVVNAENIITNCMSSDTVVVLLPTKVESSLSRNTKVYPNPFSDVLHLDFKDQYDGTIEIYNNIGQMIYSYSTNSNEMKIEFGEHCSDGLYWMRFDDGSFIKVIKNKR